MRTWNRYVRREGLLLVVSGPSGVGKDAVLSELVRICPSVRRCVSVTTRPRRESEQDGLDYTFTSESEFLRLVDEGAFLEYAEVHGYLYGTPRQWVEDQLSQNCDVVLKIDVQGGLAVKQAKPEAVLVFLVPPSLEELERRLRSRNTESEESVTRRLQCAQSELQQIPHYDYIIENSSVECAAEELKAVIVAEHCRVRK